MCIGYGTDNDHGSHVDFLKHTMWILCSSYVTVEMHSVAVTYCFLLKPHQILTVKRKTTTLSWWTAIFQFLTS